MMKKLLATVLGCIAISSVHAQEEANLRVKISGDTQNYYLCVTGIHCTNVNAGSKGKIFVMNSGQVNHIVMVNAATRQMFPQTLPTSCNVAVAKDQTLTVSGKMGSTGNINNLKCSVA